MRTDRSDQQRCTYTITDADGSTANGTLTITFDDDAPTANPAGGSGSVTFANTNLVINLDISGSMDTADGPGGMTRLEAAKAAILELLEQYDALGNVKVELVTFSDSATDVSGGFVDIAAAKALILNLGTVGSTNYDDALNTEWNAIVNHAGSMIPGAQTVSYFLSDGQPNASSVSGPANQNHGFGGSTGITGSEITTWQDFLNSHDITSYALGMGSGATQTGLNPIAYDGKGAGSDLDGIVVTDLNQLTPTLVTTVLATPVIGDLINGGVFAKFGADGGYIKSIVVQNADSTSTTYTYNPITNAIDVTGTNHQTAAFNTVDKILTVGTGAGGTLTMDMQGPGADVGHFTYSPPANAAGATEVFGYTIIDGDGDTAGSTLTVTISPATTPQVVRDDYVVTNQTSILIPDWALLYNDTGPGSGSQAITFVGSAASGDTVTHPSDVLYTDGNTNGGSFSYTDTYTSGSDTAKVTITRDTSGAIDGTFLNEILIGGSSADTINGNEGSDIILAGAGNDIIAGDQTDRLLDGGANTDTLNVGANFTSTGDGQIVNIENVTLTATGLTLNLSNQTEGFTVNGSTGTDSITTGSGNDIVNSNGGSDTINTGAGSDIVNINAGTSATSWLVDLGNNSATDKIVFSHAGVGITNNTVATISNFHVADDRIAITLGATAIADGAFQTVTAT